ncbi:MAG: hypothetical protein K6G33_03760 [Ruminococcus sp.]|uniref:hypothetical protein n=1 Tax=Ruminococcus sp. TaxID=41978 RepID=UPI0025DD9EF9|nr:hypothetical protein [Ruminococcus sp.]MCR5599847.1 hypothetical protein [Ruminococcus sp.]
MLNNHLNKLERKFGKFAISNLMLYIVLGMGVIYAAELILSANPNNTINLYSMLIFSKYHIMQGEVWRILSFVLLPVNSSFILLSILVLYFYWWMGEALERRWGSFKFNIFYFTGIIGCIIAGFIIGFATNTYLNLSLFLAFAILFPDEEILLFFVLPIKVKWVGLVDAVVIGADFVRGSTNTRIFILLSLANLFLFFGKDMFTGCYYAARRYYHKISKK